MTPSSPTTCAGRTQPRLVGQALARRTATPGEGPWAHRPGAAERPPLGRRRPGDEPGRGHRGGLGLQYESDRVVVPPSATGRATGGTSTRPSIWPRCGSCRWSTSASTISTPSPCTPPRSSAGAASRRGARGTGCRGGRGRERRLRRAGRRGPGGAPGPAGEGPSLIEALTYRLGGHWASDPEGYRATGELEQWRLRDPLPRLEAAPWSRGGPGPRRDRAPLERGAGRGAARRGTRRRRRRRGPAGPGAGRGAGAVSRLTFVGALVEGIRDEMRPRSGCVHGGAGRGGDGRGHGGRAGPVRGSGPAGCATPPSPSPPWWGRPWARAGGKRPIVEISFGSSSPPA